MNLIEYGKKYGKKLLEALYYDDSKDNDDTNEQKSDLLYNMSKSNGEQVHNNNKLKEGYIVYFTPQFCDQLKDMGLNNANEGHTYLGKIIDMAVFRCPIGKSFLVGTDAPVIQRISKYKYKKNTIITNINNS
jgi:hypothetical protein